MKRRILSCLAVLLLLASLSPAASAATWTMLRPGSFTAVAVTPSDNTGAPNEIFAATLVDNVYGAAVLKSASGGYSWSVSLPGRAFALSADPFNRGTVYAATETGLYRTTDHGATWSLLNPGIHQWILVNPADPLVLHGDRATSYDGGATWTGSYLPPLAGTTPPEMFHLKVSAANPAVLLKVEANVAYRSTDGGATWTAYPLGVVDTVEADPVDENYWYTGSCGGGATRFFPGGSASLPPMWSHGHSMAVNPNAHNELYMVSEGDGVSASFDFGATWSAFGTLPTGYGRIPEGRMIIDGTEGKIYVPTFAGLFRAPVGRPCTDADGDGYFVESYCGTAVDCNDGNASIHPNATETLLDGIDQNCDGLDLTIKVTAASWSSTTKVLLVDATSSYGPSAALTLGGYGPMTYVVPKKGTPKWTLSVPSVAANPGTVTVTGPEGSVSAAVKASRR
jgi:hypothetical protein